MDTDDPKLDLGGEGAEVFDFLDALFEDQAGGEDHELSHYLQRFPGREEAISREFLAQKEAQELQATGGVPLTRLEPEDSRVGPYELVAEIGRGGQGVVYLAEDTRIERKVALKVLPPAALLLSQDRRHRLRREAEVISRLAHPGICGIFDAEIGDELAYIAMPYVEGSTLSSLIAAARDESGSPNERAVPVAPTNEQELMRLLEFFEQAARALHSAHEVGVVHRDIKPGNLMVTPDGRPIWLDFGQARDIESSMIDLTMSGEIFGTPAYMSPEQVSGGTVTARTDIWALGISLFEALTLRRPFEGASAHALMLSIQMNEPREASEFTPIVGSELSVVLATALERDLTRRYSSALEFAEELARLRERKPIHARPASTALRLRRWIQRHPVLFLGIASITIGLVVTSTLLVEWDKALKERDRGLVQRDKALEHALGRHLAERSEALLEEDPASALVLAIEAVEHASNYLTRAALFEALEHCQLRTVYAAGLGSRDTNRIIDLEVLPNGEQVAAVRSDGSACLYDLISGERGETWRAHAFIAKRKPASSAIACALDSELIATGGMAGGVFIHDLSGERPDVEFAGPGGAVQELVFTSEARGVVVTGADGGVALYDSASGELVRQLLDPQSPSQVVAFDVSSDRLVQLPSGGLSLSALACWNARDGVPLEAIQVGDASWAAIGSGRLVFLDREGEFRKLRLSAPTSNTSTGLRIEGELQHASLSPDGEQLFVAERNGAGGRSELMNLDTGERLALNSPVDDEVTEAAFSRNGLLIAVVRRDGAMRVWDVQQALMLGECRGYLAPGLVKWSMDSESIVTTRFNSPEAHLWYASRMPDVYQVHGGGGAIEQVEFSSTGEHALTRTEQGIVRLRQTPRQAQYGSEMGRLLREFKDRWHGSCFTSDGAHVLLWGAQGLARIAIDSAQDPQWLDSAEYVALDPRPGGGEALGIDPLGRAFLVDWSQQPSVVTPLGESANILLAEYSPNGERIVSAHRDGTLHIWLREPLESKGVVEQVTGRGAAVTPMSLSFHPDSSAVAVARSDRTVHFIELEDRESFHAPLTVFPIQSLDWASTGKHFLVTGTVGRGAVRIADMDPPDPSKESMRVEMFHADNITSGCFSPDGRLALTTSLDGTVMIRDLREQEVSRATLLIAHIRGPGSAALCADFSPGPGPLRVMVGFADGSAGVWPVDPLPSAKARQPRDLAEWEVAREQRFAEPLLYRQSVD